MKRTILILVSFLLSFSLVAGCKRARRGPAMPSVPVSVYVIRPETISRYIKLTGGIEAEDDAVVYSKIGEKMENILVKLGETVEADQVLAEQYNQSLKEGVNQAAAVLHNAQSQYTMMKTDFERMQRLYDNHAISQQQFDQAKASFEAAQSNLDQARAALKLAQEQYENSLLKAPFDGQVAIIYYDENQMVPAGQPVIKIVNAKNVKAKLSVPEVDISHVDRGQRVLAVFPAFPDTQFTGSVYRRDEAIDPITRTLEIEVRIDNHNGLLKSGQFGQFSIETERHEGSIVVSDVAVMTQTEVEVNDLGEQREVRKYYAFIVKGGKALKQYVTPGLSSQGKMELTGGVSMGDSLVVSGQNVVKDGDPVRVINSQEKAL